MIPLALAATAACADRDSITDPAAEATADDLAAGRRNSGAVYLQSNDAAGNAVLMFPRAPDGTLGSPVSFGTGGLGSGSGLGNQGALALSQGGRLLYVVNAGSDEVTGFRVGPAGLDRIGTWPSGGDLPLSLTLTGRRLYVLHDGAASTVTGFTVGPQGQLAPIPGAERVLPDATPDAAQVAASPDGERLVVTEKAANTIVTFSIAANGALGPPVETPSAGMTPFGFAFDRRGRLIVSEAAGSVPDASALSSYRTSGSGWSVITASAGTTETAACWVAITPSGRYAYTTNTGSASISGYRVGHDGSLVLLDPDGVTATTGAGPLDLAFSRNGRYVYSLNGTGRSLSAFRVKSDGSLVPVATVSGLPATANGLVAQ
jgi:6-phosphogluconolactonase (cycloisomerase 2 family)